MKEIADNLDKIWWLVACGVPVVVGWAVVRFIRNLPNPVEINSLPSRARSGPRDLSPVSHGRLGVVPPPQEVDGKVMTKYEELALDVGVHLPGKN